MSSSENILAQLRDIREPPVPEVAPPSLLAVLAFVLSVIFVLLLVLYWLRNRRINWLQHYLMELRQFKNKLRLNTTTDHPEEDLSVLAQLLRRYVIHVQPQDQRSRIAHLRGSAWLDFLDKTFSTHYFTQNDGRVFGTALYDGGAENILYRERNDQHSLIRICNHLETLFRKHSKRSTWQSRWRRNREHHAKLTGHRNTST